MSVVALRVILFLVIAGVVFLGARRIWRDWRGTFKKLDDEDHKRVRDRDLRERQRPDVITLKRDEDGTYRPDDEGKA
jgi:hypothetical protein